MELMSRCFCVLVCCPVFGQLRLLDPSSCTSAAVHGHASLAAPGQLKDRPFLPVVCTLVQNPILIWGFIGLIISWSEQIGDVGRCSPNFSGCQKGLLFNTLQLMRIHKFLQPGFMLSGCFAGLYVRGSSSNNNYYNNHNHHNHNHNNHHNHNHNDCYNHNHNQNNHPPASRRSGWTSRSRPERMQWKAR